jgi:hypothetical protein
MSLNRKITIGVIIWAVLAVIANAAETKAKTIYKLLRISQTEIGITCQNGADPTGRKVGDLVIISCGQ